MVGKGLGGCSFKSSDVGFGPPSFKAFRISQFLGSRGNVLSLPPEGSLSLSTAAG